MSDPAPPHRPVCQSRSENPIAADLQLVCHLWLCHAGSLVLWLSVELGLVPGPAVYWLLAYIWVGWRSSMVWCAAAGPPCIGYPGLASKHFRPGGDPRGLCDCRAHSGRPCCPGGAAADPGRLHPPNPGRCLIGAVTIVGLGATVAGMVWLEHGNWMVAPPHQVLLCAMILPFSPWPTTLPASATA